MELTHKNFCVKRHRHSSSSKLQSAMEYLMTYGWAILIIAIVLVALFSLGVFNSANFAPKAPPGSCQVIRPFGAGTTQDMNLEGECNGELPQYVAQFNGQSSYIDTGTTGLPTGSSARAVFAWVYPTNICPSNFCASIFVYGTPTGQENIGYGIADSSVYFTTQVSGYWSGPHVTANVWQFVGFSYDGVTTVTVYNGTQSRTESITALNTVIGSSPAYISTYVNSFSFPGSIADLQVYNTSLTANEVQYLYNEGIGGAPIDLQNLVGWWPLNGNANDYSGNQNNGAATNVIYTTSWTNGYTAP